MLSGFILNIGKPIMGVFPFQMCTYAGVCSVGANTCVCI